MANIIFMTDSTVDLTEEIIKENDIKIIPLYVNFDDKAYKDLVDIDTHKLYDLVLEYKMLPKTSAISVYDYINEFKKYLDNGDEIIYCGISSHMSSSYNNAFLAVDELEASDKIHIVDSLNLSSAIGLIILEGIKYKNQGLNAVEIVKKMEEVVPKVRCHFIIDTFEYLYKGGRCSSMSKVIGTFLKIKPMIAVQDGKMVVSQKPIGHKKAINTLIDTIIKDKNNINGENVMITHSIANEDANYIYDYLSNNIKTKNLYVTNAGCVISSHCGKGTIGILYIVK